MTRGARSGGKEPGPPSHPQTQHLAAFLHKDAGEMRVIPPPPTATQTQRHPTIHEEGPDGLMNDGG
jgi:hypothetical protein